VAVDWNIQPGGVSEVLTTTQEVAKGFDPLAKKYGDCMNNTMVGLNTPLFSVIAAAVGEYATHWNPTLESAAKQVGASITGAATATKAYMEGQQEMAMNAQRAAAAGILPPAPGDPQPTNSGRTRAI
jgi:hypothetical protein